MTPERWASVKTIFNGALDTPSGGRAAYLESACNGDAALREEVQSLLDEHEQADALSSPLRPANLIGQTFAHYRILSRLGRGGMGVVYKGEDVVLGRPVALKFVAPEISHAADSRARFLREAMAAAAVIHPNLNTLLEVEEHQGQLFLVMNFVDGETLRERLARGPLPLADALRIAAHTAAGLHALHTRGIIHRDIKASNIMIENARSGESRAVITDFGIATMAGEERITRTGGELGTVAYMAPELLAGARPDARSDLWSLGVVLFEMLTGQLPFHAQNQAALAAAIQNSPHLPLATLRPDAPAELRALLDRLLAKDAGQRVQSAEEVEKELCRYSARCLEAGCDPVAPAAAGTSQEAPRKPVEFSVSRTFSFWKLAWYAVLVFVALRIAGRVFDREEPAPPLPPMVEAPETSYPGMEDSAAFSPDGSQMAFSWWDAETRINSICIKMVRQDNKVCVSDPRRDSILPAWSPDGKWIAYLRRVTPTTHEVVLSSPLGGEQRVLTQVISRDTLMHLSRMTWMPDSTALIISDQDASSKQNKLWRLSIETRERTQLTEPPDGLLGDRSPAVSRDGDWLAFVRESHLTGELAVMRIAEAGTAAQPTLLTADNRFILDMVWSQDDGQIIFAASDALSKSDFRLWRIPTDFGRAPLQAERIEQAPAGSYSPALSPADGALVYTLFQNDQNIWRMDRDGANSPWQPPQKFTALSSTRDDAYPSYSPDGGKISFVSNRSGQFELWVADADGSHPRRLTTSGTISSTSTWSPDGRQIAFDWNHNGNWDAYLISAEGGTPRRLTSPEYNEQSVTFARDGRSLYINSDQSGQINIWRQPLDGSPAVQVTHQGGMFAFESADGSRLIYTKHHHLAGVLYERVLGQATERELVDGVLPVCFFVSPRGIYYFKANPDRTHRDALHYYDPATGHSRLLYASQVPVASSLTVSPDERTILFTQRDQLGSDIMRIENFR